MGVIEFFVAVVIIAFLGWLAVFALGVIAPGHPAHIDNIVWFVVVVVIVVLLANAFGIVGRDPLIPRLR